MHPRLQCGRQASHDMQCVMLKCGVQTLRRDEIVRHKVRRYTWSVARWGLSRECWLRSQNSRSRAVPGRCGRTQRRPKRALLPCAPSMRIQGRVRCTLRKALHRCQARMDRRQMSMKNKSMPATTWCLEVRWSFWLSRRRSAHIPSRASPCPLRRELLR